MSQYYQEHDIWMGLERLFKIGRAWSYQPSAKKDFHEQNSSAKDFNAFLGWKFWKEEHLCVSNVLQISLKHPLRNDGIP